MRSAAQKGGEAKTKQAVDGEIPQQYRLTITGRVVDQDKSPIPDLSILLVAVSGEDLQAGSFAVTLRQGKASQRWNPMTKTDSGGRFTLVTDRRDWEETRRVALHAKLFQNLRNYEGFITGSGSPTPLTIVIEKGPKELPALNLGDIVFRVK